jgi:hypothetical protein
MMNLRNGTQERDLPARTFLIEPFDIILHATTEGLQALQTRFSGWLSGLTGPARFVCFQIPATLNEKIAAVNRAARETDSPQRKALLMEYRRHYETLQEYAEYQKSVCGMLLWSNEQPRALAAGMQAAFDTTVIEAPWPPLFQGEYRAVATPFWHLRPIGRPGGRPVWTILTSYEFQPSTWDFNRPMSDLLKMNFPLAVAVDITQSMQRMEAIEEVERIIQAYNVHLATLRGEDSRAVQRINDCRRTLLELNQGDALHKVQLLVAVSAPDVTTLKTRIQTIRHETRAWFSLREEEGELLGKAVQIFAPVRSREIGLPDTTHPVTSRELAMMLSPMGYRKLAGTRGILRGEAHGGAYPVFYDSWRDKSATHELWVGITGYGKTFALNCYLTREYAENGTPFDMLEPMGHGRLVADAFGLEWFSLSSRTTTLNPQDVMFPELVDQASHAIRIYETVLGRPLSGGQVQNIERGLLGQALEQAYRGFLKLDEVTPDLAPRCDFVVDILSGLGDKPQTQKIAHDLADEIGAMCTGSGPWARFLNGETNIDLSRRGRQWIPPRVFSFHEMSEDPILQAIAYVQVLSAIRRDSLIDEQPRIIAVDEVYRLMKHPSLLDFLVEAVKTFRTRRKKLICIDQWRANSRQVVAHLC